MRKFNIDFKNVKMDKNKLLTVGSVALTLAAAIVGGMKEQSKFDAKYDKKIDEKIEKALKNR